MMSQTIRLSTRSKTRLTNALLALSLATAAAVSSPPGFAATEVAGVTPGSLSVSSSGSADYHVPLSLPSGINGLTPALSLNYSSASTGEGQLGVGWNLGGLSTIARCPHTLLQDGFSRAVSFDNSQQRYCLDGKRLVPADAHHDSYAYTHRVFHTEIDDYSKIIARGSSGQGPAFFDVYKKSGEILTYGFVEGNYDSRIEAAGRTDGTIATWALGKIEDRYGNAIKFRYTHHSGTGAFYPLRIDYAFVNGTAHASVVFSYEAGAGTLNRQLYYAGSRLDKIKRIKSIRTIVTRNNQATNAKVYNFTYQSSALNGRSLLSAITECSGDQTQCFKPLSFDWEDALPRYYRHSLHADDPTHNAGVTKQQWLNSNVYPFDYNADGFGDLIIFPKKPEEGGNILLLEGKNNGGYLAVKDISAQLGFTSGDPGGRKYSQLSVLDYDGDGLQDVLISRLIKTGESTFTWTSGGDGGDDNSQSIARYRLSLKVYPSQKSANGNTLFASPTEIYSGNINHGTGYSISTLAYNADQRPDLLLRFHQKTYVGNAGSPPSATGQVYAYILLNESDCGQPQFGARLAESRDQNSPTRAWAINSHHPHIFDYNADGFSDILMQGIGGESSYLMTNTGVHTTTDLGFEQFGLSNYFGINKAAWSKHHIHVLDFNGDGLNDLLLQGIADQDSPTVLLASTGSVTNSHKFKPMFITNIPGLSGSVWNNEKRKAIPLDFNRDGLSDILLQGTDSTQSSVLLISTGLLLNSNANAYPFKKVNMSTSGYGDLGAWDAEHFTLISVDYNNDTVPDLIQKNNLNESTGSYLMMSSAPNGSVGIDRIKSVTDGLGKKDRISYASLLAPGLYTITAQAPANACQSRFVRHPLQLVSNVESDAGVVGGTSSTRYQYRNLKVHYQHGVLGFGQINTTQKLNSHVLGYGITFYHQDFPLTGSASQTIFKHSNDHGDQLVTSRSYQYYNASKAPGNNRLYRIQHTGSREIRYDEGGNILSDERTTHSNFDNYGNAGKIVADRKNPVSRHITTTLNTFSNDTAKWHLGRLLQATTTHSATGSDFVGSNITRKSSFLYDSQTGSLTRETIHYPGNAVRHTQYTYNPGYGYMTGKTVSGTAIDTRSTQYEYSAAHQHRFETKVTNALGHSETRSYDPRFGVVLTLTGPNGLNTTWTYDKFGRMTKETRADGSWTSTTRNQSNTGFSDSTINSHKPPSSVLAERIKSSTGEHTLVYADLLGRELRSVAFGYANKAIYQDTHYEGKARVAKKSAPYFQGDAAYYTHFSYDLLDRVIKETHPANRMTQRQYPGDGSVLETNAEGQSARRWNNVFGKPVKVTDADGESVIYKYDRSGNLRETHAGGHITRIFYDDQGRKTSLQDPDMGQWSYEYNVLDQLIKQTDAKGQSTYFDYDKLGRKTARYESAPGKTKLQGHKSSWTYDTAPGKGIGKLFTVAGGDLKHRQQTYYDTLGRVSAVLTHADRDGDGSVQSDEIFRQTLSYDKGRIKSVKQENTGLHYENTYSSTGQLIRIERPSDMITTPGAAPQFRQLAQAIQDQIQPTLDLIDTKQNAITVKLNQASSFRQQATTLQAEADALDAQAAQWLTDAQSAQADAQAVYALHGILVPLPITDRPLLVTAFSDPAHKNTYSHKRDLFLSLSEQATSAAADAQTQRDTADAKAQNADLREQEATTLQAEVDTLTLSIESQQIAMDSLNRSAERIENGQPPIADTYWSALDIDAFGRVTRFKLGNGTVTSRDYAANTGYLNKISASASGLGTFQDLRYQYNKLGMPLSRDDKVANLNEALLYDDLNRLQKTTHSGSITQTRELRYDALGNITYKQDNHCGDTVNTNCYHYDSRPHAVTQAAGVTYSYDANGNMTQSSAGRLISWTHFNKPRTLTQSAQAAGEHHRSLQFDYGATHQRLRMQQISDTQANDLARVTTTTWTLGSGYQQIERPGATLEHHHTIAVPGATVLAVRHDKADGAVKGESILYLHHDNLGSTHAITGYDAQGKAVLIERQHYSAFGTPLKPGTLDKAVSNSDTTPRGYTGHQMLNAFGLIHMNARLYDPALGRFLSPDTFVQSLVNPQALNRYAYVLNNPLAYTDPTGHFFEAIFATWLTYKAADWAIDHPKEALIIAAAAASGGAAFYATQAAWIAGAVAGGVGGGLSAHMAGASTRQVFSAALTGAVFGAASGGIGAVSGASFGQLAAQAVTGGLSSQAQGGSFKSGFISAGISAGASQYNLLASLGDNPVGRTIMSAAIGGTASKLSGGSFTNGAVTLGFLRLYGEVANYAKRETDRLKLLACSSDTDQVCDFDERGVLRTDGTRGVDYSLNPTERGNWLTRFGMAPEGSGKHWYDPGRPMDSHALRYFITDVSKTHDWLNSWNYSPTNGLYISRGVVFDSLFQIYSFFGMPVAAAATVMGYAGNIPFEQQMYYYNIHRNSRRKYQ